MKTPKECAPPSNGYSIRGEEPHPHDSCSASKVFRAKRAAILWRLLLAILVLPILALGLGLMGVFAAFSFACLGGALAGLAQGTYRWLCRVEVSPDGVTAVSPFGRSELRFAEVDRWSVRRGADHRKSVWKRNPVALQSNFTVDFRRAGQGRITRVHDWEVANPGWPEFVETVRSHLKGKQAEPDQGAGR
jgi:hypothetical protein